MIKTKEIIAMCLVMLLAAAAALPLVASADTEQFWYLDDDVSAAGRIMYKDAPTPTSMVTISDGTTRFTSAPPSGTNTITLEVGYWDSSFHSYGSQNLSPTGAQTVFTIAIGADQFTVYSGDYLAFRVTNNTGGAITVNTGGDGQSNLTSPPTDSGYPIPELPSIILFATGLVFLAGYLGLRRPKGVYLKT